MKFRIILLYSMLMTSFGYIQAQQIDRITLSAGGNNTDKMSYVIGETFNFIMLNGDFSLETGTEGSIDNTGGYNQTTTVDKVQSKFATNCYPNPVKDVLYFNVKGLEIKELRVMVFNIEGKLLIINDVQSADIMQCNVQTLEAGNYYLSITDTQGKIYSISKFIKQ